MRIYVLITCINPLRIYLYKDGIVRLATESNEFIIQNFKNQKKVTYKIVLPI